MDNVKRKQKGDCTMASFCDRQAAQCPEPEHKPDNVTDCNQGTQVGFLYSYIVIREQQ